MSPTTERPGGLAGRPGRRPLPNAPSLIDRVYEAFNARDFDAFRELLDEDVELVMSGVHVRGLEAVMDYAAVLVRPFPSLRIETRRVFAETPDAAAIEFRMTGFAPGDSGDAAGTVESAGCVVYRVADGRLVEWRVYLDQGEELASAALMAAVAEQSALRQVAELIAQQAAPEQIFDRVAEELTQLLGPHVICTVRFDRDRSITVLAGRGRDGQPLSPGANVPLLKGGVLERVFHTGRPARLEDYSKVRGPIGAALREAGVSCSVAGPIIVGGRLWGAVVAASRTTAPLPADSEKRVARFAQLISTAISNVESRAEVERLVAEQSALRSVAELAARQVPSQQLFDLVTEEISLLLDANLVRAVRFERDGSVTVLSTYGSLGGFLGPGTNLPLPSGTVIEQVFRTHGPARVDDYSQVPGPVGEALRREGACCAAGGPILVDGELWGAMAVGSSTADSLPPGTEERVAQFAQLVSTAISNIESQAKVARLAADQSALRRVATLVAREHSPDEIFAALAEELGELLEVDAAAILRYDPDASATVVAGWSGAAIDLPLGERFPLEGDSLAGEVHRTGAAKRKGDYSDASGEIAANVRALGIRFAVASPIVVEGTTWGAIAVGSLDPESLPADTEARIAEFSSHAAMAVANAKSRSDLAQSRARIVQAGDAARRRFERDLHDGVQQRLVSLGLELRAAQATIPPELSELGVVLSGVAMGLHDVLDDLRELSRGLHPAELSEGGLGPALRALARRSAVPVDLRLDLGGERLGEPIEVAAYYVASEALANIAKHANASRAQVVGAYHDGWLELTVRDDGQGGADASTGSGLTGLVDRVEAIGGRIRIDSPPDAGTSVHIKLPTSTTS